MMKDMGFPHLNINKPKIDSLMQMEKEKTRMSWCGNGVVETPK